MPFPFLQVRCIRIGRSGSREPSEKREILILLREERLDKLRNDSLERKE